VIKFKRKFRREGLRPYSTDPKLIKVSIILPLKCRSLVVATKEIGLEVNADKTKYMVVSNLEFRANSQYED
jgi:hypothetical protein